MKDYARVVVFKWLAHKSRNSNTWYAQRTYGPRPQKTMHMHRFILGLDSKIDHRNHNGLDNRKVNLRSVTQAQNLMNQVKSKNNKTGFKGVVARNKRTLKWLAQIQGNGRRVHLGLFDSPVKAARAYDDAAHFYHGEFACLNFPDRHPGAYIATPPRPYKRKANVSSD